MCTSSPIPTSTHTHLTTQSL
jgi:V-type H+-transporting ATPase subunit F